MTGFGYEVEVPPLKALHPRTRWRRLRFRAGRSRQMRAIDRAKL
jgi:hypothetical protein